MAESKKSDTKLRKWGECAGQEALFSDDETLTPEIRAWRQKEGRRD